MNATILAPQLGAGPEISPARAMHIYNGPTSYQWAEIEAAVPATAIAKALAQPTFERMAVALVTEAARHGVVSA